MRPSVTGAPAAPLRTRCTPRAAGRPRARQGSPRAPGAAAPRRLRAGVRVGRAHQDQALQQLRRRGGHAQCQRAAKALRHERDLAPQTAEQARCGPARAAGVADMLPWVGTPFRQHTHAVRWPGTRRCCLHDDITESVGRHGYLLPNKGLHNMTRDRGLEHMPCSLLPAVPVPGAHGGTAWGRVNGRLHERHHARHQRRPVRPVLHGDVEAPAFRHACYIYTLPVPPPAQPRVCREHLQHTMQRPCSRQHAGGHNIYAAGAFRQERCC